MTQYKNDGHTRTITDEDLVKGNVVRVSSREYNSEIVAMVSTTPAFSDCVIVDVNSEDARYVKLARPYAYVSGANTCCPSVLTGVERFEVSAKELCRPDSDYKLVVQSTGKAASFTT